MKKGGGRGTQLVIWRLAESEFRLSGLLEKGCRQLSSLRSAGEKHKPGGNVWFQQNERQELLWQHLFSRPKQWWDNRQEENWSTHPDFRRNMSQEALWLDNRYKPTWMGPQPALWDTEFLVGMRGPSFGSLSTFEGDLEVALWRKLQVTDAIEGVDLVEQQALCVDESLLCRLLKRCIAQKDLVVGKRVHTLVVKCGHESKASLAKHIVRMYACHGRLDEAMQAFTKVNAPDAYIWASVILANSEHGQPKQGINLYRQMLLSTVEPDSYVFVAVLKACARAMDLAVGKVVHADIVHNAKHFNTFVANGLVDMYAKCGSLMDARRVFDSLQTKDVVTWNAMFAGYAQHNLGQEALALYACMQQDGLIPANYVTFVCLLKACAGVGALHEGKQLHLDIQERGLAGELILANCLVDMYAKCGNLEDARRLFDNLPRKDVVTWNAMITGYAQRGMGQDALNLYTIMQQEGMPPAYRTFICLLQACTSVGALQQGKELHAEITQRRLEGDLVIGNCLVDMYAKCGSIREAENLFDRMRTKDVVTWTAMINSYSELYNGQKAMQCFQQMQERGVEPNEATFVCLLVACSHQGLVNAGQRYFKMMVEDFGITPTLQHHNCMVDLLGRSGCLEDAENVLLTMPFESNVVGWISLLTACRSHGDIERGRRCFDRLIQLEPKNAVAYILLANLFADAGRWRDVEETETLRKSAGAFKKAATACIEVNNEVHQFVVGEERADVLSKLRSVNRRLKLDGSHVPHTELVLNTVSETEKENALCGHAEKLALAYGLLNTADGTTLLVTKNLRMCNDCHSGTKIMSRLEKREIIVRDAHRVHRFMDGSCSCGDRH